MKIEIDRLSKSFGNQPVLTSIDLILPECQTLVLIGPSGSGKSTLLRILAGLEYPDEGSVTLDDKRIIFEKRALLNHRKQLGIVFQSWNLFPHLTALENIILPLYYVQKMDLQRARRRGLDLLERFELLEHCHKKPFALSGGQAQRVALIRAIAGQPRLLLLDEPTSALDPLMTAEVLELILELKREGRNLILITHHLHFARQIADQVIFIADGKILENSTSEQVFNHPHTDIAKQYMKAVLSY